MKKVEKLYRDLTDVVSEEIDIILLGNKCDLKDERTVSID